MNHSIVSWWFLEIWIEELVENWLVSLFIIFSKLPVKDHPSNLFKESSGKWIHLADSPSPPKKKNFTLKFFKWKTLSHPSRKPIPHPKKRCLIVPEKKLIFHSKKTFLIITKKNNFLYLRKKTKALHFRCVLNTALNKTEQTNQKH